VAERIGETQRIIIGLHPLPGRFCHAILKQRNVKFTFRAAAAILPAAGTPVRSGTTAP